MIPMDNPHINHRSRLKEKYRKGDLDILSFHEILELLLFYSIPRKNTNKIAHELANKFKDQSGNYSLSNIIEASDKMLKEVNGISSQTVLFFRLIKDIARHYNVERVIKANTVCGKKAHEEFLKAYFTGKQNEEVVLLTLNNRMERISNDIIYAGSVNSTKVDIYKMVRIAIEKNASGVIVAHNHPNGTNYPSHEDLRTTNRLERTFSEIGINFIDHYVVSDTNISGLKEKIYSVI